MRTMTKLSMSSAGKTHMGEVLGPYPHNVEPEKKLDFFAIVNAPQAIQDSASTAIKNVLRALTIMAFSAESLSMEEDRDMLGSLEIPSTTKE